MSDLEEMGYFYQAHASSGRLPTAKAYRVYVDSVTARARTKPHNVEDVRREILSRKNGIEDLLHYVPKTNYSVEAFSINIINHNLSLPDWVYNKKPKPKNLLNSVLANNKIFN